MKENIEIKERAEKLVADLKFNFIGEHNPKIKQIKSIISNTKPNPNRFFIAEGIWAQNKLIEFNAPVDSLFVCTDFIHSLEAYNCLESLSKKTKECYAVSAKVFEKISERDAPDGLLAIAKLPVYDKNDLKFDCKSIVLVLDGIEIPGNVGTMLRMADGAGVAAVFICNKKARLSHPKLIKGSMGAVLSVPVIEFETVESCMEYLRSNGFTVYLADTRADHHYYDEPFGVRTALVMGSERYGISRQWYTETAVMISIPMLGKCDSLNVGVAATVLCYEASVKNKLNARNKE